MRPGDAVGPHSSYSEGLLVGYRWYQSRGIAPLFPFGYGLAYTSFSFSHLRVRARSGRVAVRFTVTNTGRRSGADVAQVYVGDPRSSGEPPEQLKGFARVFLRPGQSRSVTVSLPAVAFAHWDRRVHTWLVSRGRYTIAVGDSSAALPLRVTLRRRRARLAAGLY
jgi:beta-glucosidase